MISPIRFGAIANALRTRQAAEAIADKLSAQAPHLPVAVFHSGKDYATMLGEDAVLARAMHDAKQDALTRGDRDLGYEINRRLDNWMAGIDPSNAANNTNVVLLQYRGPGSML